MLFQLRGLARDEVLGAAWHALCGRHDALHWGRRDRIDDLAIAEEAALRAARDLEQLLAVRPDDTSR